MLSPSASSAAVVQTDVVAVGQSEKIGERSVVFGWQAVAMEDAKPLPVSQRAFESSGPGRFRFAVAVDDRSPQREVTLRLARGGKVLARAEVRYAPVFQPYFLLVGLEDLVATRRDGLELVSTGSSQPLWLFTDTSGEAPHLELGWDSATEDTDKLTQFYKRLRGIETIQPYGWMEGCVLDGLMDLAESTGEAIWLDSVRRRMACYFDASGCLVYEDNRGTKSVDKIYGIEGLLPMAALARLHPKHPALELVKVFARRRLAELGAIHDPGELTAEGFYTVSYTLSVLARTEPEWGEIALAELRRRHERLRHEGALYLRYHTDGRLTFRWWARGVAWYLLGTVRTLRELGTPLDSFRSILTADVANVLAWQRPDGLWDCFLDDSDSEADTSGSAGIAAALALGARMGLFEDNALQSAWRCWHGLHKHLTPDGFLAGAAQVNRGGEALQLSDYRVISPYAMGLMAQLASALPVNG